MVTITLIVSLIVHFLSLICIRDLRRQLNEINASIYDMRKEVVRLHRYVANEYGDAM